METIFNTSDAERNIVSSSFKQNGKGQTYMEVSTIGENSIRSAYLNTMLNILDTSHLKHEGDLPTLWKLSLPPTIRNFLWRLLQGCLPTRHNLRKKHIEC